MIPLLLLPMPTTTGLISLVLATSAEVALLLEEVVVEAVVEAVAVDFQAVGC